tara:strand:+ start:107 stop:529 length:423 start_codon:yes stop_codon:yes gene_type:complete
MSKRKKVEADGLSRQFVPRGTVPGWISTLQVMLDLILVGLFVHLRCETMEGEISKLESRRLSAKLQRENSKTQAASGIVMPRSERLLWLKETGPLLVGMGFAQVIHTAKAGDKVILTIRPDTGQIRKLRNLTRPRKWWQH